MSSNGIDCTRSRITHVIFDMDGLLLDTERFYTDVTNRIVSRWDKTFPMSLKVKMMGRPGIVASKILVDELDLPITAEEYLDMRTSMLTELWPTADLMPGVERLIKHLHACGIPMAIATGSTHHQYQLKTSKHKDLFSLIHHVVTSDTGRGKPYPDIFLLAASRFTPPSEAHSTLIFEDAPLGVKAALAANMPVVMVPSSDMTDEQQPTELLSSLEDFKPEMWGMPPYP